VLRAERDGQLPQHLEAAADVPDFVHQVIVTLLNYFFPVDLRACRYRGGAGHAQLPVQQVNHYLELVYNPQRVLYPQQRAGPKGPGAKFERITWDEALRTVAGNFKSIAQYGPEAVQPYSYSGTLGRA
jgi:Molybdopterin oxidoreductase